MPNSDPEKIITLVCETHNQRLDKLLAQNIPDLSRSQAKRLIDGGCVQVEGVTLKTRAEIAVGTELIVRMPAAVAIDAPPVAQPIPLDILFEDEHLLVINKPAGLVIHPAGGHAQDTLVNALLHHYPALAHLDEKRPGIVHRLDKDTSGVMVAAKTELALQHLLRQFKNRTVDKIYLALVHGHLQVPEGIIDVPLGRDPKNRQQMAAIKTGKTARTHYTVIQTFQQFSLLKIKIETGRTHQIRVHLSWLKHPVAGDPVYGRRKERLSPARQFLHAGQLSIDHPANGKRLTFDAPLPQELQAFLDTLA